MTGELPSRPPGLGSLPHRQVILTFSGVMLAMFLGSLDQTVVGTALPRIIADLSGFSHYTWVTTAYIITSAVAIPITGKLTDMYGRKVFYIIGLSIFILASLLSGLSTSMTQLIIYRGIQGIGAGIMMANAFTVIGDLFPPADRGKYQGYISGIFGISSVIGPTLGGFLTDSLSWHWVFFINIPLGLLVIILFLKFFPNIKPESIRHKIDYSGLVTLVLTVVPIMLALSWAGVDYAWNSVTIIGLFVFSSVMLMAFIFIESRASEPIIPLSIFKNQIVTISLIVSFLIGVGMFGAIIFIPLFFQGVLGSSATASGTFLMPMMLGVVGGSFISGQLLSRAGGHYRLQGAFGLAIMSGGILLLSRMTADTSYGTAVVSIVVTGIGLGTTMPLYMISIQNAVPYNMLGVATASGTFFRSMGGSVGLGVLGSILNNNFAGEFMKRLPASVKQAVPGDTLTSLANNPQALVSPEAQVQLHDILAQIENNGQDLFNQLLQILREALSSSLGEIFFISLFIIGAAFIINFFIKEIPLRKTH
jgi:EmrB/QacA subfamily drug resistance transporter